MRSRQGAGTKESSPARVYDLHRRRRRVRSRVVSRRRLLAALAALPAALAGCGELRFQQAAPTATPSGPRTLRIVRPNVTGFSVGDQKRLEAALTHLSDGRGGSFELVTLGLGPYAPEELPGRYAALVASRPLDPPADMLLTPPWAVEALAQADALHDLWPLLSRERWFDRDAYVGNVLDTGRAGGAQVALPLDAGGEVLLYQSGLFADAGMAAPRPDWTWEDLRGTAARLSGPTGAGHRWGFYVSHLSPTIWTLAWQHGAPLVGPDLRLTVQEPGMVRALELLVELVERDRVAEAQAARGGIGGPRHLMGVMAARTVAMGAVIANDTVPWRDQKELRAVELPLGEKRIVFGDVTALIGIPRSAPDVGRSLEGLRALLEANAKVRFAATRQSEAELQAAEPGLTAADARAIASAFASARFFPADMPYLRVAAPIELAMVRSVLLGSKRPLQAAADGQAMADDIALKRADGG
jgi:hypothetical protein